MPYMNFFFHFQISKSLFSIPSYKKYYIFILKLKKSFFHPNN